MIQRPIVLLVALALLLTPSLPAQSPASLPRIAVLPEGEDKQLASLADLLTVSLSQSAHGCELVERSELNRLAQEVSIQKLNVAERPSALARLAKADGLILLSLDQTDPKRQSAIARLSAASSGLIQKTFMLPTADKDLPVLAKLAAEALRFPAERLNKDGKTPPLIISLLGIRATTSNSPGVAIETTLNAALTHHLSSIAGIAVVERWKLDDLTFERTLSEKDMPALATGTTLVDGSFEIKERTAMVKVRIRTGQSDPGKTVNVEGPADDAFALAQTIAVKVAAECGNKSVPAPWNAKAEAEAYAKLGSWLLDHTMGKEAAQAYESALALGDRNHEVMLKRIYAYLLISHNQRQFNPYNEVWIYYRVDYDKLKNTKNSFPTLLANINRLLAYAENLLTKKWITYPRELPRDEKRFNEELAWMANRVLVAAHYYQWHIKLHEEVEILRKHTESLVIRYKGRWGQHNSPRLDAFAGYWSSSPEQAMNNWLSSLDPNPKLSTIDVGYRRELIGKALLDAKTLVYEDHSTTIPLIVDWNTPDNSKGETCQRNLISQLKASNIPLNQADGIVLDIYTSQKSKKKKLEIDYLNLLEQNQELLTRDQTLFRAYDTFYGCWTDQTTEFYERCAGLLINLFNKSEYIDEHAHSEIEFMFDKFLSAQQIADHGSYISQESAGKLLLAIKSYVNRTNNQGNTPAQPRIQELRNRAHGYPANYFSMFDKLAKAIGTAYPDLKTNLSDRIETVSDAVSIRFLDTTPDYAPTDARMWLSDIAECGNRILGTHEVNYHMGYVIIDQNLTKTFIPRIPKYLSKTGERPSISPIVNTPIMRTADGFSTIFSFVDSHQYFHFSDQNNKWTKDDIIDQQQPQVMGMVNHTLYIGSSSNGHVIARVKDGKCELIVSSRRRPVEHPLDALEPAKVCALFPGFQERPYALLKTAGGSEVYDLELKKKVATFNGNIDSCKAVNETTSFLSGGPFCIKMDSNSEKPRFLIKPPKDNPSSKDIMNDKSDWDWPQVIKGGKQKLGKPVFYGDHLFVLSDVHNLLDLQTPNGDLSILCYQPGQRNPVAIPLIFQPNVIMKNYVEGTDGRRKFINPKVIAEKLLATSAGLFFKCHANAEFLPEDGGINSDPGAPGILYVTWNDVNNWLTKQGCVPVAVPVKQSIDGNAVKNPREKTSISEQHVVKEQTHALSEQTPVKATPSLTSNPTVFDSAIQKLRDGKVLTAEEVSKCTSVFHDQRNKLKTKYHVDDCADLPEAEQMEHFIDCMKMALIDRPNHGGWPFRSRICHHVYKGLKKKIESNNDPFLLFCAIYPTLDADDEDLAVIYYKKLKTTDRFLANKIIEISRGFMNPEIMLSFAKAIGLKYTPKGLTDK